MRLPMAISARWLAAALVLAVVAACAEEPPAIDLPLEPEAAEESELVPAQSPEPPVAPEEPAAAPSLDVAVHLAEVATLGAAIAGAVAPDGTLVLADRSGTVHPLTDAGAGPAIVDVSDRTSTDGERGLLGIAFAADGSDLFVSYTGPDGETIVEAFAITDGLEVGERREVFRLAQPFRNHNGGDIAVGPDGLLYLGLGDGGGGGDPLEAGQDRTSLLGALLRLDPLPDGGYAIPDDNPFVYEAGAAGEIYAYGLRNPWRFSFDADTGDLWIADVGQNAREEINRLRPGDAGANLGWNLMEGTLPFAGDEPDDHHRPVHEYDTTGARCAVTGGYVYRGSAIPELAGAYLFSDYCEGGVRAIVVDDAGNLVDETRFDLDAPRVVSFAEDADGEVYVLSLAGTVWRLDPA
jgi:glucose/arabinose dehydrogenase